MSSNRSRVRTQTLPLALASAALLYAGVVVGCGDSPTRPSSVTDVPTSSVDEIREFSGVVELPGPTTMDLSLRIQRQTADATPVIHAFFATLFAQEIGVVSGTYTLQTDPPREGEVEGTLVGPSFLTAGQFDGVLTQNTGDCTARRRYSGPVTATGINWVGGSRLQPCPSAPLAGLSSIGLTATGTQTNDPAPDPEPAPAPDKVFTLTVLLAGSGNGTVASSPSGIDCGSDCTEEYPEGTAVTLTPTSAAGSVFAGWSGDEACSDGVVTMDADHGCTVDVRRERPSIGHPDHHPCRFRLRVGHLESWRDCLRRRLQPGLCRGDGGDAHADCVVRIALRGMDRASRLQRWPGHDGCDPPLYGGL